MTAPPLHRLEETSSTQEVARALLEEGCPHGTAVVARRQRSGRGRRGHAWHSHDGGLWLSVALRPALPLVDAPRLPLLGAVLVADAVEAVLDAPGLVRFKWPNDLLVAHTPQTAPPTAIQDADGPLGPFRKVGGLLLEAVQLDQAPGGVQLLGSAVLGLGLNLTPPPGGFPAELARIGTSLQEAAPALVWDEALRERLLLAIVHALATGTALPPAARAPAFARALGRVRAASATLGRQVVVEGLCGTAEAIDGAGALVVRDAAGVCHTVHAGDVRVVAAERVQ